MRQRVEWVHWHFCNRLVLRASTVDAPCPGLTGFPRDTLIFSQRQYPWMTTRSSAVQNLETRDRAPYRMSLELKLQ